VAHALQKRVANSTVYLFLKVYESVYKIAWDLHLQTDTLK